MHRATSWRRFFLSLAAAAATSFQLRSVFRRSLIAVLVHVCSGIPGLCCEILPPAIVYLWAVLWHPNVTRTAIWSNRRSLLLLTEACFRTGPSRSPSDCRWLAPSPEIHCCHLWCDASGFFITVDINGHSLALCRSINNILASYCLNMGSRLIVLLLLHIFFVFQNS